MKYKLLITFALILTLNFEVKPQSIEITPLANYTFQSKIYARTGELTIENNESYGLSLEAVNKDVSFQLEYFYQPTIGVYKDYFNRSFNQTSDLRISWFQIGARQRFAVNERVVPFAGLSFGLTNFELKSTPDSYDEIALSFSFQGGTNIYFTDRIGLKLHGRLLMPIQFNGFGFYAGTGGAGVGLSAGTYFVQADVGAGLIFRLSPKK
jgi:hypothetical protein